MSYGDAVASKVRAELAENTRLLAIRRAQARREEYQRTQEAKIDRLRLIGHYKAKIDEVEKAHGLGRGEIYRDASLRILIRARRDAFMALREMGLSFPEIGLHFGMASDRVYRTIYGRAKKGVV